METKHLDVEIVKADSSEFDAAFVMSAGSPDRVNDTIDPKAYAKAVTGDKLIALWQHSADQPIGYWQNFKTVGDTLRGQLKIAGTNLGKMIKQLIADDVPLGASIGFKGRGEPNKKGGIHFKEIELMECSVVSIPAHPRAMQVAKSFGLEEFVQPQSEGEDYEGASARCIEETMRNAKAAILAANQTIRRKV